MISAQGNSESPHRPLTLWRITKKKHGLYAFTGEGPKRFGGRWNQRGTTVVYASDSLALAALELFVHLGRQGFHIQFVFFRIEVPDTISIVTIDPKSLPGDWRKQPPPTSTKEIGTRWADSNESVVLAVPSVIVPEGTNYLINPNHPDYSQLKVSDPTSFSLDPRMWK